MENRSRPLTALIAGVLAVLLVLALPLSLFAFSVGQVLFSQAVVTRVVTKMLVESDIVLASLVWYSETQTGDRAETAPAVFSADASDFVQALSYLDIDDWRAIKTGLLPDRVIGGWVASTFEGMLRWLNSDDRLPSVTLDMRDFKNNAGGENGEKAVMTVYDALPPCWQDQIEDFEQRTQLAADSAELLAACPFPDPWSEAQNAAFRACAGDSSAVEAFDELCAYPDPWTEDEAQVFGACVQKAERAEASYNLCQFPNPWVEDQIGSYNDSFQEILDDAPDDLAVVERLAENQVSILEGVSPETLKGQVRLARTITRLSLLLPLALLALIFLVMGLSIKRAGNWMGIPLIVGGGIAAPLTLIHQPIVSAVRLAVGRLPGAVPDMVVEEATDALLMLTGAIFRPMLIEALVAIGLGLVLVVVGAVVRRGERRATQGPEGESAGSA